MSDIRFRELSSRGTGFWLLVAVLSALVLVGLGSALYMEHNGHYVTGMTNQIVWGMPHVFAVFLIVAASGILNVASIGTVFNKELYKPLGRLSGLMANALLAGGLAILVLDLGHPDRLIVAMTHYNFKSIFAWNIFFYSGFFVIVFVYVWFMMERRMRRYYPAAGFVAFIWRLALTTGTGSIFGFLVARQAYDAAVMAPMFILMSFSFGLAIFVLALRALCVTTGWQLGDAVAKRLKNLLALFVAGVMYFVTVFHLTNLYSAEHQAVERFILIEGGIYTFLFWFGYFIVGSVIPLILLYHPKFSESRRAMASAAALVVIGGFALMYVIIIGGQAFPLIIFPDMEVTGSTFYDGVVNSFTPSLPEIGLGIGGIAIAAVIVLLSIKLLRFTPESMSDEVMLTRASADSAH